MPERRSDEILRLQKLTLIPQDIRPKPDFPDRLTMGTHFQPVLSHLVGTQNNQANSVQVSEAGALRAASYGSDFTEYDVGTATGTGSFANGLAASTGEKFHRWDILVENEPADIRFRQGDNTFGGAIKLTVGISSIDFTSDLIQVKNNGASAATIQIVGYR